MSDGVGSGWVYYVDESHNDEMFCLTGLGLKLSTWRTAFECVKDYRKTLKQTDGVFLRTEIHARDLVSGRGHLGEKIVGKWRRSRIFYEMLELISSLPDAHLFNVCLNKKGRRDVQLDAWERLLNRIDRTCEERNRRENAKRRQVLSEVKLSVPNSTYRELERRVVPYSAHALIIADQGRETEIVRLKRKMAVFNYIPSRYGKWGDGAAKNIPVKHFVEDTLFLDSANSYMIQLVDCAAYALLKKEVPPTPLVKKYSLHKAFESKLKGICYTKAAANDENGIVRK